MPLLPAGSEVVLLTIGFVALCTVATLLMLTSREDAPPRPPDERGRARRR